MALLYHLLSIDWLSRDCYNGDENKSKENLEFGYFDKTRYRIFKTLRIVSY